MKKYRVNLNGKAYEVELEELEIGAPAPAKKVQETAVDKAPASTPSASQGSEDVTAPMPGNIIDVRVNVGDTVKSGQTLIVLEAMKLENEIVAPRDGKVAAVNVSKGDSVVLGDKLVSLE